MKRVMQSLGLALVVTLSGCDQNLNLGSRCNSKTCKGCCDAEGVCQPGVTENACGVNGGMCLSCESQQCVSGVCQGSAATGGGAGTTGGGTGGTGGGSAGIGGGSQIGRIDQELVSGTRLRAVRWTGADGAQKPMSDVYVDFYDTQLKQYCQVGNMYAIGLTRSCYPFFIHHFSGLYADAACSRALVSKLQFENNEAYSTLPNLNPLTEGPKTDGGTGLYLGAKRYSGSVFKVLGGSCAPTASSEELYEPDGREVMKSELAVMEPTVE